MIYKKGTILLRKRIKSPKHGKYRNVIVPLHEDLIQDAFWIKHYEVLQEKPSNIFEWPQDAPIPNLVLTQLHIECNTNLLDKNDCVNQQGRS